MTDSDLTNVFDAFDDVHEAWESRAMKRKISEEYAAWLMLRKPWRTFITLTFKNETFPDVAKRSFNYLVRKLNSEIFGSNYMNKIKGSYFSYVIATEYQKREVLHFHVLVDRPVNYDAIHRIWKSIAGFAQVKPIKNFASTIKYISKYETKGGDIDQYFADKEYTPDQLPLWWIEFNPQAGFVQQDSQS